MPTAAQLTARGSLDNPRLSGRSDMPKSSAGQGKGGPTPTPTAASSKPRVSGRNARPESFKDEGAALSEGSRRNSTAPPALDTSFAPPPATKKEEKETAIEELKYGQWTLNNGTRVPVVVDMLMRLSRNPCNEDDDKTMCDCGVPCRLEDFYAMQELTGVRFIDPDGKLQGPAQLQHFVDTSTGQCVTKEILAWGIEPDRIPARVKEFLSHEHENKCTSGPGSLGVSPNIGALRNSPYIGECAEKGGMHHTHTAASYVKAVVSTLGAGKLTAAACAWMGYSELATGITVGGASLAALFVAPYGSFNLGHRHAPGPQEFFKAHGSHRTFVDAVGIDIVMLDLDIDEAEGEIHATYDLTVSWYDKQYGTRQWDLSKRKKGKTVKVTSHCAPKIRIDGVLKGDAGWHDHANEAEVNLSWKEGDAEGIGLRGTVFKTMRMQSTIRQNMNFHECPVDMQEFKLCVEMPESGSEFSKDHNRYFVPLNVAMEMPGSDLFDYHRAVAHIPTPIGECQQLACFFRGSRKVKPYIVRQMFPVFMFAITSFSVFLMPFNDVGNRMSVIVPLLLLFFGTTQQLDGQDIVPSVPYFMRLDYYYLAHVNLVFAIALESLLVAYMVGIDSTTSKMGGSLFRKWYSPADAHVADSIGTSGSCDEAMSVSSTEFWSEDTALEFEAQFQIAIIAFFITWNVYFIYKMSLALLHRTWRFGPQSQKEIEKGGTAQGTVEEEEILPVHESVMMADDVVNARCTCLPCQSRATRTMISLEDFEKYHMSQEEMQVYAAFVNAGLQNKYELRTLVPALIAAGLNVPRMKDLDEVLLAQLLGDFRVKAKDRIELMMAARDQVDLMFLQGSASYLFLDLGLAGKLVTKAVCLERIDTRFSESNTKAGSEAFVNCGEGPDQHGKVCPLDHDLKSFANLLYGFLLMNSSATPTMYFLSQRECQSAEGPIYSQLWAGFAAYHADRLEDEGARCKIVVVELGSGEFRRFLCKLEREKPVERVEEEKDTDTPDQYKKGMQTMYCDLQQHYKDLLDKRRKIVEPGPEVYEEALTEVANAILGNGNVDAFIAKHGGVDGVYFLATSSTRKFFSEGRSGSKNDRIAADFAKILICKILTKTLEENLGGNDTHVDFRLLLQKDEAKYEFYAAKAAINYAVDIPLQAQANPNFAALAWGNGFCQGYNCGDIDADTDSLGNYKAAHMKQMLSLEIGVEEVTKQIEKNVEHNIADRGDITGNEQFVHDWFNDKDDENGAGTNAIIYKKTGKRGRTHTRIRFRSEYEMNRTKLHTSKALKKIVHQKVTMPITLFPTVFEYIAQ